MTSLPTNPTIMLRHCLLVAAFISSLLLIATRTLHSQQLQRGIAVVMPITHNATPVPEADNIEAWVIAVTRDGSIYFGLDKMTPESLIDKMSTTPRHREAKLYIKADASAPFSSVRHVLQAARTDLFDDVVLLTRQTEAVQPRTIVPPKGLDAWIADESGSNFEIVQIDSRDGLSTVRLNNEAIVPPALQSRLAGLFDTRAERIVVLKASGQVPYAIVVQAIDACRGAGASRVSIVVTSEV